jgi:hypothetical protein
MTKKIILLAVFVVVAAVIAFGLREAGNGRKVVAVGLSAPEFTLVNGATGKPMSSSELRGKVIFLHFWATG